MSTETQEDPYASIPLGFTRFDWTDPTLDAECIGMELMGYVDYHDLPEFEGMKPWEIERQILFDLGRKNWGGLSPYSKPAYEHMLVLTKLMFPQTFITPAIFDIFSFFCTNFTHNRKGLHLIGSQNAGKSFGSCILAFVTLYIDPSHSATFVANPSLKSSDSQAWGTIKELWGELVEAHPVRKGQGDSDASALFPKGRLYRDRVLDLGGGLPKAGVIKLQSVKDEGNFRGIKAFGKDVGRGVVLLIVDEINMNKSHAFYDMIDNLQSQPAFMAISSQNYTDPESLGGRITEPTGLFGGPDKLDDLDIEDDQYWHCQKSGVCLRLDGHRSPNILANRNIYDKLFTLENRQTLKENGGEESPSYYCQARSFPVVGNADKSVLSKAKISASRHLDPFFTMKSIKEVIGFCDPAFGGQDQAVIGFSKFGQASVTEADGSIVDQELMIFDDFFHNIPLVKGAVVNEYWIDRLKEADIDINQFTLGSDISYEDQVAIGCKEWCKKKGVKSSNFGFDFSMRADCVASFYKVFGPAVQAFDYNAKPEGTMLQNVKKNSEDYCKNRNTELHMLAADLFLTKQVRGGGFIGTAITQLSRTHVATIGNAADAKKLTEDKKTYKDRWSGKSPDHRDVLCSLAGLAIRRGFRQAQITGGQTNGKSIWSKISALGIGQSKIGRKI